MTIQTNAVQFPQVFACENSEKAMTTIKMTVTYARKAIGFALIGTGALATVGLAAGGSFGVGLVVGGLLCGVGTILVNGRKAFAVPEGIELTGPYYDGQINPASGLPMNGLVDTAGNPYGADFTKTYDPYKPL